MTEKPMFEPYEDRVMILPDEAKKVSDGGVIIPDAAQRRPARGTVMFCGPGTERHPMRMKPGDRVIFGAYAGTEQPDLIDPKKLYLIMRTTDVFARI